MDYQRHQISSLVHRLGVSPTCRQLSTPQFWPLAVTSLGRSQGHVSDTCRLTSIAPRDKSHSVHQGLLCCLVACPSASRTAGPRPLPRAHRETWTFP